MLPLDLQELFRDTPLAGWYAAVQGRWEPYLFPVLSDASRIALMWKFGGIYLDTDFIVLKNLRNLTNVLGTQSRYVLNGAFLAFERRHEFMALCMRDFVDHYNGWIWGHQGPQLLTRVFKKWCSIRSLAESHACRGVTTLPPRPSTPSRGRTGRSTLRTSTPRSCHSCSMPPMLSTCGTRRARARGSRPRPGHCSPSSMPATAPRHTRP